MRRQRGSLLAGVKDLSGPSDDPRYAVDLFLVSKGTT